MANIESLEKAPPEMILINPVKLPDACSFIISFNATTSTPGTVIKQPNRNTTISINV